MHVWMNSYIETCIYTYRYIGLHIIIYVHVRSYMFWKHIYLYTYKYTGIHTYKYICMIMYVLTYSVGGRAAARGGRQWRGYCIFIDVFYIHTNSIRKFIYICPVHIYVCIYEYIFINTCTYIYDYVYFDSGYCIFI